MWREVCRNMRTPCFGAHIVGPWGPVLEMSFGIVLYHKILFGALCFCMDPASGLLWTIWVFVLGSHLVHGPVLGPLVRIWVHFRPYFGPRSPLSYFGLFLGHKSLSRVFVEPWALFFGILLDYGTTLWDHGPLCWGTLYCHRNSTGTFTKQSFAVLWPPVFIRLWKCFC